ncbi:major facilitator superfamily transporter [Nocardia nova SH22a]|uniref:Major facilitator superfamily transporter n=1 Tax=Nocardia nova SH22a TaxID=1415166 RepID=W5TLL2_9NOCA|nr:MFS transporter [Nocardia nova]AHH20029.1 major facilitator superfamily transporter [Nocardia nova SH22a]
MFDRGYMSVSAPLRAARTANSVAFALQGFFLAVILTELPQQRDRLGLTDTVILVAVVMISGLAAGGSLLAERVALRWSSRVALRAGLLLIAVTGLGIAAAPNLVVDLIALGCYGVAVGMVDAGTNMQAVFIQHGYGRFVLSSFYAAWSAGSILGALFVSGCEKAGITLPYAVAIAAVVVALAAAIFGPRLLGREQAEAHSGTPDRTTDVRDATAVPLRAYLALGIAMALVFAIDLAVGNWSALYLTDDLLSSSATAALALAAYQGASLLTRLTGDWWVRRFGARAVVRVAATIGVAGLVLVVAAPGPVPALAGFLVAGLGLPVIAPLCFSEAGRLTDGSGLDAVIARLNLFNYAGTLIGGGVVGAVADASSLRAGFVIPLLFAAALIPTARFFRPRLPVNGDPADRSGRVVLDP